MALPLSITLGWVFLALEQLGRVGERPFAGLPSDVPVSTLARTIEIDLRQQMNQPTSQIPKPMAPENHVQM
jgi:putative membrane protein